MSFSYFLSLQAAFSNQDDEADYYDIIAGIYQNFGAGFDVTPGYRNALGSRKETALSEDNLRGVYDDSIWVAWIDKKDVKHVAQYQANTDPNYRYVKRGTDGKDADKNKKLDIGRLPVGFYTYKTLMEYSKRLKTDVFKMKQAYRVERDINHDGSFNEEDIKLIVDESAMMVDDMHIHRGGDNDTWSAGCQTMPRNMWDKFVADISAGRAIGQVEFTYLLTLTA